jgi:ribosomal protein S6E (S10)
LVGFGKMLADVLGSHRVKDVMVLCNTLFNCRSSGGSKRVGFRGGELLKD